ncbi:MAG: YIP1 family protein [Candidatus Limnocylindria bacterium]
MDMSAPAAVRSITDRMLGAARLDRATYEEVEADRSATGQAAFVVVGSSIAAGIGGGSGGGGDSIVLSIGALVAWALYAWLAYVIGTKLLAGPGTKADWGEVARSLGFANAPRFFLLLGVVPALSAIVALAVGLWVLVATVVALRAALDFSTGRAIATAFLSTLAQSVVAAIVLSVLA